jgi:hypothetical protein
MNPFRSFAELALELRSQVLYHYATDNPCTQEEAAALAARLEELAADCRVTARRMGCAGSETAIEALLQATVDLFNAPAQLLDPYSRANHLAAAVPFVAKLADDFDAEARLKDRLTNETAGWTEGKSDEQLPVEGAKFIEEEVPPSFREGGKPEGAVLTANYLADSLNWLLNGPYLTKHYGKELTTHIKVGRTKAYLYTELLVLRDRKTANEQAREEKS